MSSYHYHSKNVRGYLKGIYDAGLQKSNHLSDTEVEELISNYYGSDFQYRNEVKNNFGRDVL